MGYIIAGRATEDAKVMEWEQIKIKPLVSINGVDYINARMIRKKF